MRIFFALPIAAAAAAAVEALCTQLQTQRGWRWVPKHNWHITLAFLGETDEAHLPALTELGERSAAGAARGSVALTALEWWPTSERPRLLALTGTAGEPLLSLHRQLLAGLAALDIAVDARPLRPHLTLVRLQRGTPPPQPVPPGCRRVEVPADTLVLYRSGRDAHGVHYLPLWQRALG